VKATPPNNESNPVYSIVYAFKLLLTTRENNAQNSITYTRTILSKVKSIFSNNATAEAFAYFCLHGAATACVLQYQLGMPEPTAYRALKHLRSLKIVVPALKITKNRKSKGGPRPTIWAIEGASPEDIAEALRLHYRMISPKYRVAEEVAQTIIDEYITPRQATEVTYREIIIHVKELKIPFVASDVADLAASYLHDKGIKVWR
jgi:hypothetical protein